jgi:trimeric autotransporter adhesin
MTTSNARRYVGATVAAALVVASGSVGVVSHVAQAAPTTVGTITGAGYGGVTRSGVFRDIDSDGTWDAGEPGQSGITVTATCVADTGTDTGPFDDVYGPATSTTTAADGSFTLSGADVRGLCRVEFAIPTALQTFLQPGVATIAVASPNSAGTHVQFVDATLNPTVTTAVHNPGDHTGLSSTPDVATGRSIPGAASAAANNIAATYDTVLRTDYALGAPTAVAQGEESGSIWGIAWEPATESIFAAAVVKRHSGLLAGGPDAIYAYGASVPAGWATPFTSVDTDAGAVANDAVRGLGDGSAPSDDDDAFALAGTLGWGDLDISEDGRTLYGVNLKDKTVQPIDIATKAAGTAISIPTPACTNGAARPWGLEVNDGLIYAGVVCDAATGTAADLAAFVFATTRPRPPCPSPASRPVSPPVPGAAISSGPPPPGSRSTTRRVVRSAPTAASGTRGSSPT